MKAGRATIPHIQAGKVGAVGYHLTAPVFACFWGCSVYDISPAQNTGKL